MQLSSGKRQGTNLTRLLSIERTVVDQFNLLLPYCCMRDVEPLHSYGALLGKIDALTCLHLI